MFLVDDDLELFHDVGMLSGEVVVFVKVVGEVVKRAFATAHNELPIATAHGNHVCLMKFPIEMVVLHLLSFPRECGKDGHPIEIVFLQAWVAIARLIVVDAGDVAESGHEVVENHLLVAHLSALDVFGPVNDERHTDASLEGGAFRATEQAIVVEESGVCAALFVWPIVGGENNYGVACQAFFFEFGHDFSHLGVQACHHGGKLGVPFGCGVVARRSVAFITAFGGEAVAIGFDDAVVGLGQFCVRQGVGEDAEERLCATLLIEPSKGFTMDEVGRILLAFGIIAPYHVVLYVLVQDDAPNGCVAFRTGVAVEEIGEIEMGLILANVAVKLVNAPLVGSGSRAFVAPSPFAEQACGVAIVFENFGQNDVGGVVGLLSHDGVVLVLAIGDEGRLRPVFPIATNMGVSCVLTGHESGTRGRTHGRTSVGLSETHTLSGKAIDVWRSDEALAIATEIAIAHVVTHDVEDIGTFVFDRCLGRSDGGLPERSNLCCKRCSRYGKESLHWLFYISFICKCNTFC